MNNTAVHILAITLFVTGLLAGCSSDDSTSEEDFLDSVREEAKNSPTKGSESGNIDPNNGSIATIELETKMFELGPVSNSEFTFKEMYVFNRGKAPLEINNITTTCPCTTAVMKEGDNVIEPESEGTMIIKFDPERASGYFSLKKLTIHSNDPHKPMVYVDVSAHVDRDMLFVPEELPVQIFEEGAGGEIEIRIIQNSDLALELGGLSTSDKMNFLESELTLLPKEEWANENRREYLLKATILPTAPSGSYRNTFRFGTNIRRAKNAVLPIEFKVAGNYIFEPSEITLRAVEPGVPMKDVLTLNSKFPLSISSIKSSNSNITVEERIAEDGLSATFDLLIAQRPDNRLQKDTWTITFKSGDQEITREINVVALLSRQ